MFDHEGVRTSPAETVSEEETERRAARDAMYVERRRQSETLVGELDNIMFANNQNLLVLLRHLVDLEQQGAWDYDSYPSLPAWICARYGVSRATANVWVRVAGRLEELPCLAEAFWDGSISWDQFEEATRVATPDTDASLSEEIVGLTVTKIRQLRPKPTTAEVCRANGEPGFWWGFSPDTPEVVFHGRMPDETGLKLINALERKADQQDPNPETGVFDGRETILIDALALIVSESISNDPDPDRATVVITATFDEILGSRAGAARFMDGMPLADDTLDRLLCDSRIQMVIKGEHGIVGVGRTTRSIPPWLARVVRIRDGECQFEGCTHAKWLHIHHIDHWAKGGPTELWNLISLCLFHHQFVHESKFSVEWGPNQQPIWRYASNGQVFNPKPPQLTREARLRIFANRKDYEAPNRESPEWKAAS